MMLYFDSNLTVTIAMGAINNNPAMVYVLVWRQICNTPLFEPIMA